MKKRVEYIFLLAILTLLGCNPKINNDELVGLWLNENERCSIKLNEDFTFKSTNVPLDVANKNYLAFNKKEKMWQGVWTLEGQELKLTINDDSYYYLEVNASFPLGKPRLSVKLLDESGGEMIYFDKK